LTNAAAAKRIRSQIGFVFKRFKCGAVDISKWDDPTPSDWRFIPTEFDLSFGS